MNTYAHLTDDQSRSVANDLARNTDRPVSQLVDNRAVAASQRSIQMMADSCMQLRTGTVVQRHGPGINNSSYVEGDGAHLDRHLNTWTMYFPEVTTVQHVRDIARELFYQTNQEDWVNNGGGSYGVIHQYHGHQVVLAWGLGGIVSCYIKEPRVKVKKQKQEKQWGGKPSGSQSSFTGKMQEKVMTNVSTSNLSTVTSWGGSSMESHSSGSYMGTGYGYQQPQYVMHAGYMWTPDYNWWFDTISQTWRSRVESVNGSWFDWYTMQYLQ